MAVKSTSISLILTASTPWHMPVTCVHRMHTALQQLGMPQPASLSASCKFIAGTDIAVNAATRRPCLVSCLLPCPPAFLSSGRQHCSARSASAATTCWTLASWFYSSATWRSTALYWRMQSEQRLLASRQQRRGACRVVPLMWMMQAAS